MESFLATTLTYDDVVSPNVEDDIGSNAPLVLEIQSAVETEFEDTKVPAFSTFQGETTPQKTTIHDVLSLRCSPRLNNGKSIKHLCKDQKMLEDGTLQICAQMLFDTFEEMYEYVLKFSQQNGFTISRSTHRYKKESENDKAKIFERFPVGSFALKTSFTQRGTFKCTSGSGCPFEVRFTHVKNAKDNTYKYGIKPEGLNLEHNGHAFKIPKLNKEGSVCFELIHREKELTRCEAHFIRDLAIFTCDNIGKIRENMQRKYLNRNYESNLLKRVVNKYRDDYFGKGRDQINQLVRHGNQMKENGGAFDLYIDGTFRLKAFILQTKEMRSYASMYNDFVILDGTHGTNRYGLILEPPTLVDCMGRSVIAGIPICEVEENEFSSKILLTLGLQKDGATLMTDEGSAFFGLAESLGMTHILCAFHFQKKGDSAVGGLGDFKAEFLHGFKDLIFHDYESSDKFDVAFKSLQTTLNEQCPDAKDASTLLHGLYKKRYKIGRTFTKDVFTCGHTSTARGEGTNSSIKGRGDLKKVMKGFGLFMLVEHILLLFQRRQGEAIKEIVDYLKKKSNDSPKCKEYRECSKYVYDIWSANAAVAASFNNTELLDDTPKDNTRRWKVVSPKAVTSYVTIYNSGHHPTCTCGQYCSTKIPCPCICAIFFNLKRLNYKAEDLHPRWRMDHHPLWKAAHDALGFSLTEGFVDAINVSNEFDPKGRISSSKGSNKAFVPKDAINKINAPKKQDMKYAQLKVTFDKIAQYAVSDNLMFQRYMALFLQEVAYLDQRANGNHNILESAFGESVACPTQDTEAYPTHDNEYTIDACQTEYVLPPLTKLARKRARITQIDVANKSKYRYSRVKVKK